MRSFLKEQIKLKGGDAPDEQFDPEQLKRGIEVEKEHTDDPEVAKQIAKAHLLEIPDYYTRLDKMEADAKEEMKLKNTISERLKKLSEAMFPRSHFKSDGAYQKAKDGGIEDVEDSDLTRTGLLAKVKAIDEGEHGLTPEEWKRYTRLLGKLPAGIRRKEAIKMKNKLSSRLEKLQERFKEQGYFKYMARKPTSMNDLRTIPKSELMDATGGKRPKEIKVSTFDELDGKLKSAQFWIATVGSTRIFIDTQGYDYPRYAAIIR